ncbi:MAG: hypothetical protein KBE77_03315 [Aliarcobacter sp.]|nr:hypothetical protein [Aliarcobacter sp.]
MDERSIANTKQLTVDFGSGFTPPNLRNMRQFYLVFSNCHTLCSELSWSHYRFIMRIENENTKNIF